jgi:hypothetical protein
MNELQKSITEIRPSTAASRGFVDEVVSFLTCEYVVAFATAVPESDSLARTTTMIPRIIKGNGMRE